MMNNTSTRRIRAAVLLWAAAALNGLLCLIYLVSAGRALYDYLTVPVPDAISYMEVLEGTAKLPPHISSVVAGFLLSTIPAAMCLACIGCLRGGFGRHKAAAAGCCLLALGILSLINAISALSIFPSGLFCTFAAAASILFLGIAALFKGAPVFVSVLLSALSVLFTLISPIPVLCPRQYTAVLCIGAIAVAMTHPTRESKT